jgi:hypothetical protein
MPFSVSDDPRVQSERENNNSQYLAMIMHTSSDSDLPFSPTGLLLLAPGDFFKPGISCVFIVGKTKNMLLFRGGNSPQWTAGEALGKINFWDFQIRNAIKKHAKADMNDEEKDSLVNSAHNALIRRICEEYDFGFFAGDTSSQIVTKQFPKV